MKNSLLIHLGLALLRIVPSALLMTHGYPKLQKLISGDTEWLNPIGIGQAPSLFLAMIGEFICPILII
ncbi:MAG: DoxX family protein, partial [Allomuricauda sp.]